MTANQFVTVWALQVIKKIVLMRINLRQDVQKIFHEDYNHEKNVTLVYCNGLSCYQYVY